MSRSASRRELAKTMLERCSLIRSRIWFSTWGQIEGGLGGACSSSKLAGAGVGVDAVAPRSLMSSTGTTIDRSHDFSGVRRHHPDRMRSTEKGGDPLGWSYGGRQADPLQGCREDEAPADSVSASSRSRETSRWAPRLVPARACTSSTITVRTDRRRSRAAEVSIKNSDSGVVIKMSGGRVMRVRRSAPMCLRIARRRSRSAALVPAAGPSG